MILNPRWEQFAQRVASGESATAAYRAIYKAPDKSAEAHGCRLVRNGKVSARIAEMQRASEESSVMSLQDKREFLALIVRTPIGRIDENSPLCQWFRRTTGRRASLSIRMPDKLQAIMLDARLAGELKGNTVTVNATASVTGYVMTPERIAELQARKRAAVERRRASLSLEQPRAAAVTA